MTLYSGVFQNVSPIKQAPCNGVPCSLKSYNLTWLPLGLRELKTALSLRFSKGGGVYTHKHKI